MLGAILSLLAAATFAFNNASVRRGVLNGSAAQAMAITVPAGIPIFLLTAVLLGGFGPMMGFSLDTVLWLSAAGMLHFLVDRYGNYRATKPMGSVLAGPVQQGGLIFTLALAIWVLDETLTPLRMMGIVLVVLGPALSLHQGLSARKAERRQRWPPKRR